MLGSGFAAAACFATEAFETTRRSAQRRAAAETSRVRPQWSRSALISFLRSIFDRPSMSSSPARLRRSLTVQSSYEPASPPLLARPAEREVLAAALAIRAAFSLLAPWSRTFS